MITSKQVEQSITVFLETMFEKKTAKFKGQIDAYNEQLKSNKLNPPEEPEVLKIAREQCKLDNWLELATRKHLKSIAIGTHNSKGVHTSSKGDSVVFNNTDEIPVTIAGSHNLTTNLLDASGNASSLSVYDFITTPVVGTEDLLIKDLIESSNHEFIKALHEDEDTAHSYNELFKALLANQIHDKPATSDLNKQILFPINADDLSANNSDTDYINIIPLHPSVLCFEIHERINQIREDSQEASDNRYNKNISPIEQAAYKRPATYATLQLGGSKAVNAGKLSASSYGEVYLLPSFPPKRADGADELYIPLGASSIFKTGLLRRELSSMLDELAHIYALNQYQPNYAHKTQFKATLTAIICVIYELAFKLRQKKSGWLIHHNLNINEKFWLDPNCDSSSYAARRESANWQAHVTSTIAHYINDALVARKPKLKSGLDNHAFDEWRASAVELAAEYKLHGKEVLS